ncbi:hypothetical protein [Coleofasciculus sp. FACHB-SPT36]|uniref:hypothetical protein n=1 Tax=Cyanophyceae TaxID=3028117 RepID=UPI00168BDAC3|nr:hypothetical protein [Coleofasciculus sp. FACHB-SPT36]MBD2539009.1 hypothetical protein [Coleofasciculus sp. FACHB-SPT36]
MSFQGILVTHPEMTAINARVMCPGSNQETDNFNRFIYGLLWSRGNILRSRALSSHNPFAVLPDADRELLLDVLQKDEYTVWLNDPDWQEVKGAFKWGVSGSLIARPDIRGSLKSAILGMVTEPVQLGFL